MTQAAQSLHELRGPDAPPRVTGDFAPVWNMVARRATKANMANMAHIGCKGGHSHWLLAHMGFWERTFLNRRRAEAALFSWPRTSRGSRCWKRSGPRPCMGGSQLPEAGFHAGMHAFLGTGHWDATTQCSMAHGSWTAPTLSP